MLKALNRFQSSSSRKNFSLFLLFVVLVYFLLNINGISDWVKGQTQGQHQGERAITLASLCISLCSRDWGSPGERTHEIIIYTAGHVYLFIIP